MREEREARTRSLAVSLGLEEGALIGLEQRKAKNRAARAFKAQCKEVHDGTTMVGAEDLVSQQDFFRSVCRLDAVHGLSGKGLWPMECLL